MRLRPLLSALVLVAASSGAATLRADGPGDALPDAPPAAAETFVPVPPVEGVPGPLFFETPTLSFVPKGTVRITTGARFLRGVSIPSSGLAGDLAQLGLVRIDVGFGSRIEVRIQGAIRQRLRIDEDRSGQVRPAEVRGDTTQDSGDFSIITIARVMPERGWKPAVGLRIEAKLPNTDEKRGIGTNTTDILLSVPFQKDFGRLFVVTDLGLGILTEPTDAQSQNDVLLYGLAAAYAASLRVRLSGEVAGRWSPAGGHPGTGDQSVLRAGVSWASGPAAVGVTLSRGLAGGGERFGITLAISYGFRVVRRISPE